jgi:beta-N-acetylhexosaminidase
MDFIRFSKGLIAFIVLFFGFLASRLYAQIPTDTTFSRLDYYSPWVNHQMHKLTRRKKISQIFMVAAYSNKSKVFSDSVGKIIKRFQPGGIIFFQGGPIRQVNLCNDYQKSLKVPAMIAMDAEWGLAMRIDSTMAFPYQMTLGALDSNLLLNSMGKAIGGQLKRMGVQVNFAPVLDVNNNIHNTVINYRSFGENKIKVSEKGMEYMRGLQSVKVLATGKHFPGHGDTEVDSHKDLPVLPFSKARLDTLELFPFRAAIQSKIGGIMIAHMNIPIFDTTPHLPSSLSYNVVQKVLKDQLGYKGLIFTDAMNMKGVIKYFAAGEAELMALKAGNDIIEMSTDLKKSLKTIRKSIRKKQISRDSINLKCRKILAYKEWMGLSKYMTINTSHLYEDLQDTAVKQLIQRLSDLSITVLKDYVPPNLALKAIHKDSTKGVILSINPPDNAALEQGLKELKKWDIIPLSKEASIAQMDSINQVLKGYPYGMVIIHDKRTRPGATLNFPSRLLQWISILTKETKLSWTILANPYTLSNISGIENVHHLIITYQDAPFTERSALKYWKGEIVAKGHLPVTIPNTFQVGTGIISKMGENQ